MGESQVGKTSLVSQFLTSDFLNTYDASLGKENQNLSKSLVTSQEAVSREKVLLSIGNAYHRLWGNNVPTEKKVFNSS